MFHVKYSRSLVSYGICEIWTKMIYAKKILMASRTFSGVSS